MNQPSRYLLVSADGDSDVFANEYSYDDLLNHLGQKLYHNDWEEVVEEIDKLDHVCDYNQIDIRTERVVLIKIE